MGPPKSTAFADGVRRIQFKHKLYCLSAFDFTFFIKMFRLFEDFNLLYTSFPD